MPPADNPSWKRPSAADVQIAALLLEARQRAGLSRPAVLGQMTDPPSESMYAAMEGGRVRITIGALEAFCAVLGANPIALMVRAGLGQVPVDVEQALELDPELDDLGRQFVTMALVSARAQARDRRAQPAKRRRS